MSSDVMVDTVYADLPRTNYPINCEKVDIKSDDNWLKNYAEVVAGYYIIYNSITRRIYVGKSSNLYSRLKTHYNEINNHTHGNPKIRKDSCLYPKESWVFGTLELFDPSEFDKRISLAREEIWMRFFENRGYTLYNKLRLSEEKLVELSEKSNVDPKITESHAVKETKSESVTFRCTPTAYKNYSLIKEITGLSDFFEGIFEDDSVFKDKMCFLLENNNNVADALRKMVEERDVKIRKLEFQLKMNGIDCEV